MRTEATTERPMPTSFKRIVRDPSGIVRLPQEMARYRVPSLEQRRIHTTGITEAVRSRYETAYPPEVLGLGLTALETFLTHFAPIPRPTEGESPMQYEMVRRAQEKGHHVEIDDVGNVAFVIPGKKKGVIVLQHHLDEVAVAKEGSGKHPEIEGIETELIERDGTYWIQAKDGATTLGADNGAGGSILWEVAEAMDAEGNDHPTIVVLGTVGEEGKMDGASQLHFAEDGLVASLLNQATVVVNNDMELDKPEPTIIVGSFGLETFKVTQEVTTKPVPANYDVVTVSVSDLQGGHSGLYADRAHAGKILIEELVSILGAPTADNSWNLCSFTAGEKHNEIASVGHATLALPHEKVDALQEALKQRLAEEQTRFGEPNMQFRVETPADTPTIMLDQQSTQNAVALLSGLAKQHGIHVDANGRKETFTYTPTGEELYTRALNIGVVRVGLEGVNVDMSARIGIAATPEAEEAFRKYERDLAPLHTIGGNTHVEKGITVPTWKLGEESSLPEIAADAYTYTRGLTGSEQKKLKQSVVTAGLEVSMFQHLLAQAQDLVFGMYITDIHKPGEALQIPSFIANAMLVKTFLGLVFEQMDNNSQRTTEQPAA